MKIKKRSGWVGRVLKCPSCDCEFELEAKDGKRIKEEGHQPGCDCNARGYGSCSTTFYIKCPGCGCGVDL